MLARTLTLSRGYDLPKCKYYISEDQQLKDTKFPCSPNSENMIKVWAIPTKNYFEEKMIEVSIPGDAIAVLLSINIFRYPNTYIPTGESLVCYLVSKVEKLDNNLEPSLIRYKDIYLPGDTDLTILNPSDFKNRTFITIFTVWPYEHSNYKHINEFSNFHLFNLDKSLKDFNYITDVFEVKIPDDAIVISKSNIDHLIVNKFEIVRRLDVP